METINQEQPDFLAVAGDMTTFGTRPSTARILAALECVQVPVLFTPGNAELRSDAGLPLLGQWLAPANRHFQASIGSDHWQYYHLCIGSAASTHASPE